MKFKVGQGVFGRVRFRDGNFPAYDRPYLIVGVTSEYIEVLNISSIKGKERKLAFPTNRRIKKFFPPFQRPSFVKLDSLVKVPRADWSQLTVLDNGRTLDSDELAEIIKMV